MNNDADRLVADRELRDQARSLVTNRFTRLKTSLDERGLGQRVADQAVVRAKAIAGEAVEVANDSRGIIIGTVAVLAAWLLRKPILQKAEQLLPEIAALSRKAWSVVQDATGKENYDES